MNAPEKIYGLLAEFSSDKAILAAAENARHAGYRHMDAYTPFPIDGLAEALGRRKSLMPLIVLLAGAAGGLGGYLMEWYANVRSYPLNIAGRPFNSWPAFIPVTFELTILSAALAAILGMLALNRLPELHHPVFNARGFERASTDKFFLCIEARDPKFDLAGTRRFLATLAPEKISEVVR
jgi:hypothetical protein